MLPESFWSIFVLPWLVLASVLLVATGCETPPRKIATTPPPAEIPVANLPEVLREWNWTDARGSGSCVHASLVYHLRWQNQLELAEWWRANHAGGETSRSIRQYLDQAGLKYEYTERADAAFLEWATAERRGAIIWFWPYHCVHFCGFSTVDGVEYALLCDNNRVEKYIRVEKQEFLRRWLEYGGFGCTVTSFSPVPPPLFPAFTVEAS